MPSLTTPFRPSDLATGLQGYWKMAGASNSTTAVGSGGLDTVTKKFGAGSYNNVDAANNYMGWADRSDITQAFTGGTGDWTVEMWVYFDNVANNDSFCSISTVNPANDTNFISGDHWIAFNKGVSGGITVTYRVGGVTQGSITHQNTVSASTWYHVAFVKSSNVETLYLDGVASSSTLSSSQNPSVTSIIFGTNNSVGGGDHFDGRIDEFRISNTARYTGAFTPSASAFTVDANTFSLIHCDASPFVDEGQTATLEEDSSGNGNDLTNNNTVLSVAQDYWNTGERSGDFEASNSEYLSATDATAPNLDFTSAWSACAWIKPESNSVEHTIVSKWSSGSATGYYFTIGNPASVPRLRVAGNATSVDDTQTGTVPVGKWTHVAVVIDSSGNVNFYVDGNLTSRNTTGLSFTTNTHDFGVGAYNQGAGNYTDGLLKDVAVWNVELTPLQIKSLAMGVDLDFLGYHPDDIDTAPTAYWKLNELDAAFNDSIGSANLTNVNTVTVREGYLDGVGALFTKASSEYLHTNATTFAIGTNDFSFAGWVKFDNVTETYIWDMGGGGANNLFFDWHSTGGGRLDFAVGGTTSSSSTGGVASKFANTWYHIALVRRSGTVYFYIDGQQAHTFVAAGSVATADINLGAANSGAVTMDGMMSDHAFWNGYGLSANEVANLASGLPVQQSGFVSYFQLNETSGTRVDAYGDNDLSEVNTVGSAAGKVGNGANLIAANSEYLTITDGSQVTLDIVRDFSIFAWVKPATTGITHTLIDKGGLSLQGYALLIENASNQIEFFQNNGGVKSTSSVSAGVWTYGGGTWDGATKRTYFDSVQQATGASTTLPVDTAADFYIGRRDGGTPNYADAVMDEVIIATRYFRDEEIKALYIKGLNGKEATSSEIAVPDQGSATRGQFLIMSV